MSVLLDLPTYLGMGILGTLFIIVLTSAPIGTLFALGISAILLSATSLPALEATLDLPRLVAAVLLLCVLLRGPRTARYSKASVATVLLAGLYIVQILISLPHGNYTDFAVASGGFVAALVGILAVHVLGDGRWVVSAVQWVLLVYLVVGLVLGLILPEVGILGDRLRGLANNPNLLAFFAVLCLFCGVVTLRGSRWFYLLSILCGVTIVWSGSRTGLVAAGVLLLMGATRFRVVRSVAVLGVVVLLVSVSQWTQFSADGASVLRSGNSRAASVGETLRILRESPWIGVGEAGFTQEIASSPLRVLAAGGLIAGAVFGATLVAAIAVALRRYEVFLLLVVGLASSLTEGWLVSLTGSMVLVFIVLLAAVSQLSVPPPAVARVHAVPSRERVG